MNFISKILNKASNPFYSWIIFFMTIFESIFLFIPPEIFIAPAIISDKKKAFNSVIMASIGSLIGGAISYLIGFFLFDSIGIEIINFVSNLEKFNEIQNLFIKHGVVLIILTAITPIPYKLLAISAGFMNYSMFLFLLVSAIFRTARFSIYGYILWKFQKQANDIIKKHFWKITLFTILVTIISFIIISMN